MKHVEVLRELPARWRASRRAYDGSADDALADCADELDAAIAALSAPHPPAEAQPVALDYVPVKRSDLLRWAEDFVRDNDPGDDTDVVTPFDDYLLRPPAEAQPVAGAAVEVIEEMRSRMSSRGRVGDGPVYGGELIDWANRLEAALAQQPAAVDEVVCLECGQPTMHMGQVCYACSHPAKPPAEAQARPAKPAECADGCPDQQVCDHCQWPPGPDAEAQAQGGVEDNQCDGCRAGYGTRNGIHVTPEGSAYTACQSDGYATPSAPVGVEGMVEAFEEYHRADHRDPAVAPEWEWWQAAWNAALAGQQGGES